MVDGEGCHSSMTVATSAEIIATSSVVYKGVHDRPALEHLCIPARDVKPPQWVMILTG